MNYSKSGIILKIVLEVLNEVKLKIVFVLLLLIIVQLSCQDKKSTVKALKESGYNVVEVGGYSWFGCPSDTWWRTKFKIKDKSNEIIDGCYCEGFSKQMILSKKLE